MAWGKRLRLAAWRWDNGLMPHGEGGSVKSTMAWAWRLQLGRAMP